MPRDAMIELVKNKLINVLVGEIFSMGDDISRCLEDNDSEEFETNQDMLGMRELF